MINKNKYEECRLSLLNIARLTNKENSILINFDVVNDICKNVVSFIQQDGTTDILKNFTFECDDEFYKEFLEKVIKEYCATMDIAFNDSIDINSDGKCTFRIVTDDNDMLCVNGIALDYANYLASLITKKESSNLELVENEKGVTTALATFILVVGIGLTFLITLLVLS